MTQTIMYTYLGTNGTICSPVHLEDIYYIRKVKLMSDINKVLTKDGINFTHAVIVSESEANEWYEVDISEGQE